MLASPLIATLGFIVATTANPVALKYDVIAPTGTGVIRENGSVALLAQSNPFKPTAIGGCQYGVDPYGYCCADSINHLPTNHGANSDGWGVWVTNGDGSQEVDLYVYSNGCDYVPFETVHLGEQGSRSEQQWIPLPHDFQGRITRGTPAQNEQFVPQILGTWFELSYDPSGNGQLWGDVSHIRGYDGSIQFETMDGQTVRGFSFEYMDSDLDPSAYEFKPVTGTRVIGPTEGAGGALQWAADNYCLLRVPNSEWVYCDDSHLSPVIVSPYGQQSLQATFFYHFL